MISVCNSGYEIIRLPFDHLQTHFVFSHNHSIQKKEIKIKITFILHIIKRNYQSEDDTLIKTKRLHQYGVIDLSNKMATDKRQRMDRDRIRLTHENK